MLTPSKQLDPDRSPLRVAAEILNELRVRRSLGYDQLFKFVARRIGDSGDAVVAPAMSLLFLLGKIEYHPKTDSFEYLAVGTSINADK